MPLASETRNVNKCWTNASGLHARAHARHLAGVFTRVASGGAIRAYQCHLTAHLFRQFRRNGRDESVTYEPGTVHIPR